jgi:ribosomal protein L29
MVVNSMQSKVKTFELRSKSKAELNKQLDELRRELLSLRVKQQAGKATQKALEMFVSPKLENFNSLRNDGIITIVFCLAEMSVVPSLVLLP